MNKILKIIYLILLFLAVSVIFNLGIWYFMQHKLVEKLPKSTTSSFVYATTDQTKPISVQGYDLLMPFVLKKDSLMISFDLANRVYRVFIDPKEKLITVEENYKLLLDKSPDVLAPFIEKMGQRINQSGLANNYFSYADLTLSIKLERVTLDLLFTDMVFESFDKEVILNESRGYLLIK